MTMTISGGTGLETLNDRSRSERASSNSGGVPAPVRCMRPYDAAGRSMQRTARCNEPFIRIRCKWPFIRCHGPLDAVGCAPMVAQLGSKDALVASPLPSTRGLRLRERESPLAALPCRCSHRCIAWTFALYPLSRKISLEICRTWCIVILMYAAPRVPCWCKRFARLSMAWRGICLSYGASPRSLPTEWLGVAYCVTRSMPRHTPSEDSPNAFFFFFSRRQGE